MTPESDDLSAREVKRFAQAAGADLVGIAPPERWEGAPRQMDPRYIMPEARSIITLAFRIMRGSLRGIEEGTFFSNYSSMGYGGLSWLYMPMAVINIAKFIEDHGYEAVPLGHLSPWRAVGSIRRPGELFERHSRPVEPGKPAPDVMVHLRIAGYLCGLGEIGYSKVFLTPEFGPAQRLGVIMTEAELEPDPLYEGPPLCDRCMQCAAECPGEAISRERTVQVTLAGRKVEWGELDCVRCDDHFIGGAYTEAGETGDYVAGREDLKPSFISPFYHKPPTVYEHGQAICGGRGCLRACLGHLEKRGVLRRKFHRPFRRRKPWTIDWSQEPEY